MDYYGLGQCRTKQELQPGLRVNDFGQIGSGQVPVCQIRLRPGFTTVVVLFALNPGEMPPVRCPRSFAPPSPAVKCPLGFNFYYLDIADSGLLNIFLAASTVHVCMASWYYFIFLSNSVKLSNI